MYLAVFLSAASLKLLSKQTVSSTKRRILLFVSHHTMSGLRSVVIMCSGNLYPLSMSADRHAVGARCGLIAVTISQRTSS